MAKSQPDERVVYLALKGVFQGQDVHLRQFKNVLKLIQKHKDQAEIKRLIKEYTLNDLCQTAKALLKDRIFESTLQAKLKFPDVFEVSPNQTAERAVSELAAAKNEDAAIQNVAECCQDELQKPCNSAGGNGLDEATGPSLQTILVPCRAASHTSGNSLYPVYLPLEVQHRLLNRIQSLLEHACFNFAAKHLPNVLEKEMWDCAEAVELNRWAKVFLTHQERLNPSSLAELEKSLPDLLSSIAQIRHTAVHRLRLTAKRTLQFVLDAESLVKLFHDNGTFNILSTLRHHVQTSVGEIERNKDMLELRMANTKAEFVAIRAETDRQEREASENAVKEDKSYTALAGANLLHIVEAHADLIPLDPDTPTNDKISSRADCDKLEEELMDTHAKRSCVIGQPGLHFQALQGPSSMAWHSNALAALQVWPF